MSVPVNVPSSLGTGTGAAAADMAFVLKSFVEIHSLRLQMQQVAQAVDALKQDNTSLCKELKERLLEQTKVQGQLKKRGVEGGEVFNALASANATIDLCEENIALLSLPCLGQLAPARTTVPGTCPDRLLSRERDDDDDFTPDATWKAGLPRHQPCQVYKNAQGRAKQKAYRGQTKQNHTPLKGVEYNAYQAKQWKSIPSMLMGETQPLCTGAREPKCEQTRKDDQGQLHPSPLLGLADHAWKFMQGRLEGGGSFGNGLLHSRPLPRRRMNQRPQAFPTLHHGPDSRQHHSPSDHMTDRRRWVNQPQVPLLSSPQPALHLSADSLSNRTLPESMLPQPFAIPMGT
jgi:hypothetical protein